MSEQLHQQLKSLLVECIQHPDQLDMYMGKIIEFFKVNGEQLFETNTSSSRRNSSIFDGDISSILSSTNQRRLSNTYNEADMANNINSVLYDNDGID
ncbi:unnamed protein product [Rotaria sordida]|uniref:Uncharacterized protein n=1 Tax=Rotaria sordida TaxID=392033 RepID=A0A815JRG9_9BILA|nr:unnamed protein product [Rotaria sordida]CAF1381965.1 unnamed protein product [Rotaria sordida]CAF1383321.1 unnamed protein product [Rotaria sordida]CAF1513858.1 unnamed protein product [Rotaria sordida]CAF1522414.1 unnamed protein product [Rotaria sordida]